MPDTVFTGIREIEWRVNIIISSRDLLKVLEPTIYFQFHLSDGNLISMEVPMSKFHSLRQSVALLLKEMEIVRRKGTNIVRIIAPPEAYRAIN